MPRGRDCAASVSRGEAKTVPLNYYVVIRTLDIKYLASRYRRDRHHGCVIEVNLLVIRLLPRPFSHILFQTATKYQLQLDHGFVTEGPADRVFLAGKFADGCAGRFEMTFGFRRLARYLLTGRPKLGLVG